MPDTILIIDDEVLTVQLLALLLERRRFEVIQTFSADEGLRQAYRHQPDLVLLDVNMPGLSGEKLAEVYRSNAKTRSSRVMLYSSNDEDTLRAAARRLQLDGYICKGNPATLRLRVAAILAR